MEDALPHLHRTNSRFICLALSSKKLLKVLSSWADSGGGSNGGVAGLVLTVRGNLTGAPAGGGGPIPAVINPLGVYKPVVAEYQYQLVSVKSLLLFLLK